MSVRRIDPIELMNNRTADTCILDVRTTAEIRAAALPDCLHIPLHELTPEHLQETIQRSGKIARRYICSAKPGAALKWQPNSEWPNQC